MISFDEDALICDLAETYGIYDYESLPVKTVATLAVGLRGNSRIKMKLSGSKIPSDSSFLLAMIIDRITDVLTWFGAYKENKRPDAALDLLYGLNSEEENTKYKMFDSVDDFEQARSKFFKR